MSEALAIAESYAAATRVAVQERVAAASLDAEQHAAHGYAWIETSVEALRALLAWGEKQSGEAEALVVAIGTGETLAQLAGGLPKPGSIARGSSSLMGLAKKFEGRAIALRMD